MRAEVEIIVDGSVVEILTANDPGVIEFVSPSTATIIELTTQV